MQVFTEQLWSTDLETQVWISYKYNRDVNALFHGENCNISTYIWNFKIKYSHLLSLEHTHPTGTDPSSEMYLISSLHKNLYAYEYYVVV